MPKVNSNEPELELNAKWSGPEFWKDWGKGKKDRGMVKSNSDSGGAMYFAGLIGSVIYWMQAAIGFGAVITGLLKSLVWPVYIVYKLLESFYGVVS
jgi:hypothetical protein